MVYILCHDNILSEIQFQRLALLAHLMGGREEGVPSADEFIVGADILGPASLFAEAIKMTGKPAQGFAFIAAGQQSGLSSLVTNLQIAVA